MRTIRDLTTVAFYQLRGDKWVALRQICRDYSLRAAAETTCPRALTRASAYGNGTS